MTGTVTLSFATFTAADVAALGHVYTKHGVYQRVYSLLPQDQYGASHALYWVPTAENPEAYGDLPAFVELEALAVLATEYQLLRAAERLCDNRRPHSFHSSYTSWAQEARGEAVG